MKLITRLQTFFRAASAPLRPRWSVRMVKAVAVGVGKTLRERGMSV